jgi:hypothetical protein
MHVGESEAPRSYEVLVGIDRLEKLKIQRSRNEKNVETSSDLRQNREDKYHRNGMAEVRRYAREESRSMGEHP